MFNETRRETGNKYMKERNVFNKMGKGLRKIGKFILPVVLLAAMILPIAPVRAVTYDYPVLPTGMTYYQTTFPAGLRYSEGWYGTFTSAPRAYEVYLFDDDWTADFGRAVFAMPPAPKKQPSGPQGGTVLTEITMEEADAIIKSYTLDMAVKPWDAEIEAVMEPDHYFVGAWIGDKLKQKWNYGAAGANGPPENLTQRQKDYIKDTHDKVVKTVDLIKYDPDRFWVGDGGNWSDNTTHWSATSNGTPGASLPTSADNVFFDANSFSSASQTVTVDGVANCLNMDWTGATNTPTLSRGNFRFNYYGNATFIAAMVFTGGTESFVPEGAGVHLLTTNGLAINSNVLIRTAGSILSLQDAFTIPPGSVLTLNAGELTTNGNTLTADSFTMGTVGVKVVTLGASTVNLAAATGWNYSSSNLTLTPNTSTINIAAGSFSGGGITTYNIVNLNGTAHTISGNNTFSTLSTNPANTQTITFTDNTKQTATTFNLSGTSGKQHTLQGSGVVGWNLSKASGTVNADYITISRSTATGGATFNAVGGSVNGNNNVGWNFPLTVSTGAASGISMDKDGVTAATIAGTITDMGGSATVGAWWDWGLTIAYGAYTANVTYSTTNFTGEKTTLFPTNTPGATYHFRRSVTSGSAQGNGADAEIAFTMPTVTTGGSSQNGLVTTLTGTVTNMGVATSTYGSFQWGYDTNYGNTSTQIAVNGVGDFTRTITNYDPSKIIYYRAVATNTPTEAYGSAQTFYATGSIPNAFRLANILPIIFLAIIIMMLVGALIITEGLTMPLLIALALTILVGVAGLGSIQAALTALWGGG